jgi:hypothetical protein
MSRRWSLTVLATPEAQRAWDTLVALPLATQEQRDHARDVLSRDPTALPVDTPFCELFLSGAELAALRLLIVWLKANDRAGRLRDLPIYPDVAEAIVGRLGPIDWQALQEPACVRQPRGGGVLSLHPCTEAPALLQLINAALRRSLHPAVAWPPADRRRLMALLQDIACWLESLIVVHGTVTHDSSAAMSHVPLVPRSRV